MSTIRYTAGGDYDPANSIDVSPAAQGPLIILERDGDHFTASNFDASYEIDIDPATNGIYADFSDRSYGALMEGGDKGDVLIGGGFGNELTGDGGNDFLQGGGMGDEFFGGAGIDTVSYAYASAAITLYTDRQSQTQSTGDAQGDVLDSIEVVVGTNYADAIYADGTYTIEGGGGGDTIQETGKGTLNVSYAH